MAFILANEVGKDGSYKNFEFFPLAIVKDIIDGSSCRRLVVLNDSFKAFDDFKLNQYIYIGYSALLSEYRSVRSQVQHVSAELLWGNPRRKNSIRNGWDYSSSSSKPCHHSCYQAVVSLDVLKA